MTAETVVKHQKIELRRYYGIPLHCPFCGAKNFDKNYNVVGCSHLILHATPGYGLYQKVSPEVLSKSKSLGYVVEYEEPDTLNVQAESGEDVDLIDWIGALDFDDLIVFEQIEGAPTSVSTFSAYRYTDEEYSMNAMD